MGCGGSKSDDSGVAADAAQIDVMVPATASAAVAQPPTAPAAKGKSPPMPNPMAELQQKMKARGAQSDEGAIVSSGGAANGGTAHSGAAGPDALLSRAKGAKGRRPPSVHGRRSRNE